ncbi:MAG: serine hydrolase, partial [Gemmatimonadota bacterium]
MRAAGLFSLLLSTGLAGCAAGSHGAADPGSLDHRLYALLDSAFGATAGVPGVMLRVEAPRRGFVWEHALGLSDRDEGTALRPTHALRIASITKTCVAASVLRLVEEGALELDDPVEAHLSPSTCRTLRAGGYDPGAISVRMLMQHTSGLADHATADAFLARILGTRPTAGPGRKSSSWPWRWATLSVPRAPGSITATPAISLPMPLAGPVRAHQYVGAIDTDAFE